jgi:hypothetical protein
MSSDQSSRYPPSMGPGARPVPQGESGPPPVNQRDRARRSRLQEVIAIRETYSVVPTPSDITISYKLDNRQRTFTIPYSAMPLGAVSSQICFGGRARAAATGTMIIDTIRGAENITGMQLTQQQAEGFARYSSKRMLYSYACVGSSIGLAAFFWRKGRDNMKFPFIKVRPPTNYLKFPNRYLPILRDGYARTMWQITRFNVYLALGVLCLGPLFRSMGDTSMIVGLYRDDRTRPIVEKMKGKMDSASAHRITGNLPSAAGTPSAQPDSDEFGSSDEDVAAENTNYGGEGDVAYYDGMNSTGDVPASTQPSPSQLRSQVPQQQQQRSNRWPQRAQQQASQSDSYPSSQEVDPFAFNEDPLNSALTDPNSPQYDPSASAQQPQKPRRRSWASIRNEARQGNNANTASSSAYPTTNSQAYPSSTPGPGVGARSGAGRGQQGGSGESYSYGADEANKQYAKEQAQKEFDAMLDKERRLGEQGNTDSGRSGAWGRRRGD